MTNRRSPASERRLDIAAQRQSAAERRVQEKSRTDADRLTSERYAPLSIALREAAHADALREAAQRPDARLASLDAYSGGINVPQAGGDAGLSSRLRRVGHSCRSQ